MFMKSKWARERQFSLRLAAITIVAWIIYVGAFSGSRLPHYYNSRSDSEVEIKWAAYLDCFKQAGADIVINPSPIQNVMGLPQGSCPGDRLRVGLFDCLDVEKLNAVETQRADLEKQCSAARQVVEDRFDAEYSDNKQHQHFRVAAAIGRDFVFIPVGILIFFSLIAHPAVLWLVRGLRSDMRGGK
jgi:hypothetical protein